MNDDTTAHDHPNYEDDSPAVSIDLDDSQWSIDDILEKARLPETVARVCLRADLQAEADQLREELRSMVDAMGNVIEQGDESLAGATETATAKARRLHQVEAEMQKSMRVFKFRGLPEDELAKFEKAHRPKNGTDDAEGWKNWMAKLAEETCIQPNGLTVEKVHALRKKLGARAIQEINKAVGEANYSGGVSVPTSPASWHKIGRE